MTEELITILKRNVCGMTILDREKFAMKILVNVISVENKKINDVMKKVPYESLKIPNFRSVREDPDDHNRKYIFLNKPLDETVESMDYKFIGNQLDLNLHMSYENFTFEQILRAVLPEDICMVGSFETIGHIAHFNLRDEHLPFRFVIGQLVIDKYKNIKTVVNKLKSINSLYRQMELELIGGIESYITNIKYKKYQLTVDYKNCYYNSRLQSEHWGIISMVSSKNKCVIDMFAGVGPFAIGCAINGSYVFANDLNPISYEYLLKNVNDNKMMKQIECYNLDGLIFIEKIVNQIINLTNAHSSCNEHETKASLPSDKFQTISVLMNLPNNSIDFLMSTIKFMGKLFDRYDNNMKIDIYIYMFIKKQSNEKSMSEEEEINLCRHKILSLDENIEDLITFKSIRSVRKVSPNKSMLCSHLSLIRPYCSTNKKICL